MNGTLILFMTRRTSRAAEYRVRFAPAVVIVLVLFLIVFDFIFAIVHQRWLFAPVARKRDVQFTRFDAAFPRHRATRRGDERCREEHGKDGREDHAPRHFLPLQSFLLVVSPMRVVWRCECRVASSVHQRSRRRWSSSSSGSGGGGSHFCRQKAKKRDNFLCFFLRDVYPRATKSAFVCVCLCVCVCLRACM